jgi:hypothetical protein
MKLRSKVVEVEAVLYDGSEQSFKELSDFVGAGNINTVLGLKAVTEVWNNEEHQWITIPIGHYVIKGTSNEFYPCSPGVLDKKYDIIDD